MVAARVQRGTGSLAMTVDPATYPAPSPLEIASWRRPDPARSRAKYEQPLTNAEMLQADAVRRAKSTGESGRGIPPIPDTGRPRRPHPGDLLYWVACLGAASLLLLAATR